MLEKEKTRANIPVANSCYKRNRIIAISAMIGSAACWGGATVMSRDLLDHFLAPTLLVVQLTASVLVLLLISLRHYPWQYFSVPMAKASLTGLLEPGLTYSIGLWGLNLTSAASASIIGSTEPIFIVLLAWLIFKNKPSNKLLVCILVAVLGLLLVSSDSLTTKIEKNIFGDMLIVLSTVFAASYVVFSAKWADKFPAAVLASGQQIVGLLYAVVVYMAAQTIEATNQTILFLSWNILIYGAVSGIVQYALAFWLYLIGLKHLTPSAAGLWLTLVPMFGIAGAYFWLDEVPTLPMLLGMLLIVGSVIAGRLER